MHLIVVAFSHGVLSRCTYTVRTHLSGDALWRFLEKLGAIIHSGTWDSKAIWILNQSRNMRWEKVDGGNTLLQYDIETK